MFGKLYIAVVMKRDERAANKHGDWASFVDVNQHTAIERALKARQEWQDNGFGPYVIRVGELQFDVCPPPSSLYTLESL